MPERLIDIIEKYDMQLFAVAMLVMFCISITSQTVDQVRKEIHKYDIDSIDAEIILAQSVLESGWYRSAWCKDNSNIFGLTKSLDGKRVSQTFLTWKTCVRAYYVQIYKRYVASKKKDYYRFLLDLPYAMDTGYIPKVKTLVAKIKDIK